MKRILVFFCLIMVVSCANTRLQKFYQSLDSSVNTMTYDQAIMTWGQPISITQGDEIFVATWANERTGAIAMPIGNMFYAAPVSHGSNLQLTFDKRSKIMRHWRYREW